MDVIVISREQVLDTARVFNRIGFVASSAI